MKKIAKVAGLALIVLVLFVSCHECDFCGKFKICKSYSIFGEKIYICSDCSN